MNSISDSMTRNGQFLFNSIVIGEIKVQKGGIQILFPSVAEYLIDKRLEVGK